SISPQLVEPNSGQHVRVQEELEASFRISCIAIDDDHNVAPMGCSAAVLHREPTTLAVINVPRHLPTNTHDNHHNALHGVNLTKRYRRTARRASSSHAIQQRYEEHQYHPERVNDICAVTVITNAQGISMDHTIAPSLHDDDSSENSSRTESTVAKPNEKLRRMIFTIRVNDSHNRISGAESDSRVLHRWDARDAAPTVRSFSALCGGGSGPVATPPPPAPPPPTDPPP
ncbi:Hypothetical protein, putative, partial [Bodo saltans]